MQWRNNTILISGGSSGIGRALAVRLLDLGNEVIVTGRGEKALLELKAQYPEINIRVSDAGVARDRVALAASVVHDFPRLNILINNAGIQRSFTIPSNEPWEQTEREISINLAAPLHFSTLLVPHLCKQTESLIVNVSSGLAFVPLARVPVYCATKAALHSFTLSLREQLKGESVGVIEIIPPAVKTNLGGSHNFGVELDEFADSVIEQLKSGVLEVTFGTSTKWSQFSRSEVDGAFRQINGAG
jgi:uncharacterized oxidoreductase